LVRFRPEGSTNPLPGLASPGKDEHEYCSPEGPIQWKHVSAFQALFVSQKSSGAYQPRQRMYLPFGHNCTTVRIGNQAISRLKILHSVAQRAALEGEEAQKKRSVQRNSSHNSRTRIEMEWNPISKYLSIMILSRSVSIELETSFFSSHWERMGFLSSFRQFRKRSGSLLTASSDWD
jgi:hypothetical protein